MWQYIIMDKFDNNILAVIIYVISNVFMTVYIYFNKKFSVEKFKTLQKLQESILEIVSTPPTSTREIIANNAPYPSPVDASTYRDIILPDNRILRIHN